MKRSALVAAAGQAGCSLFAGKVSVYVDNGADVPIEVVVDGGAPVSVPAGGVATISVAPGSRKFSDRHQAAVVHYRKKTYGSALPSFDPVWDALKDLSILEPDPWLKGPYHAVFGESLPETIHVREGETPYPKFKLCRVTSADYDLLVATKAKRPSQYPEEVIAAVNRASLCK